MADTAIERFKTDQALEEERKRSKTEKGEALLSSVFIDVSEVPTIIQLDLLKDWIEGLTELYSNTLESFETRH